MIASSYCDRFARRYDRFALLLSFERDRGSVSRLILKRPSPYPLPLDGFAVGEGGEENLDAAAC
jgi:hypothetical protein